MTLTFEHDLDRVKKNQLPKQLSQKSFISKVTVQTHTHTHCSECSTWTTKVASHYIWTVKNGKMSNWFYTVYYYFLFFTYSLVLFTMLSVCCELGKQMINIIIHHTILHTWQHDSYQDDRGMSLHSSCWHMYSCLRGTMMHHETHTDWWHCSQQQCCECLNLTAEHHDPSQCWYPATTSTLYTLKHNRICNA